jgi:glycosyltransferase involved in cell wall biosynthesis
MRLLHIGSGFRPMRLGGLVAYSEDLMNEQVRRGHELAYFFSGRYYPFVSGPRLRRWEHDGIAMFEVVNSPLYDHGRQPRLELDEPHIERMLARAIDEVHPDVVHVHELAGLPTSLLDVARDAGAPVVYTLQDYYPLCPMFKLLDADGRVCLRRQVGAECVATTAADPREPGVMYDATVRHELLKRPWIRALDPKRPHRRVQSVATAVADRVPAPPRPSADDFQRRRDVNVERMNRTELLIAMSSRVAEIYEQLGVDPERIRTVHLTLRHIERLRPREPGPLPPVTFATLNGFASRPKGAHLLVDAVRRLSEQAPPGSFRVLSFGHVDPAVRHAAEALDAIELRGYYGESELDRLLDEVDVGIVPSIWEEAYGYVGVEFLAKGIPVLANAIGGMVDYARSGETGWLNRSLTADELARIMLGIVESPHQVVELSDRIRANRDTLVKTVSGHADEMDAIYGELAELAH